MARAAVAAAPNRLGYGKRLRPGRPQLFLVALIVVGIWVVAAFAGAINQLSTVSVRHAGAHRRDGHAQFTSRRR